MMATLRDIWERKRLSPTEVAGLARISLPTLYKMNKKEGGVRKRTIRDVCEVLGITQEEYEDLEAEK